MYIYLLILEWGLDLEKFVELVKKVIEAIVTEEYRLGMELIFEWVVPRASFDVCEGIDNFHQEVVGNNIAFVRWQEDGTKARYREEARRGWEALKVFVQLMEVEAILQQAIEKARMMEYKRLRLRKRKVGGQQILAIIPGSSH
ncbi:hypothetical protein SUGI_0827430 [Cryptomeria japonica]|nr:hypothetical protein SUGI_0827430 [Cryptomeria japonica]